MDLKTHVRRRSNFASLAIILFVCFVNAGSLLGQLDEALQAHGGIEKFRQFRTLEYDLERTYGGHPAATEHHLYDLYSRKGLITSQSYKLGFDGSQVWITNPDSLRAPARFYIFTPFYFFGLPFLFADPGANQHPEGTKTFQGTEYSVLRITFGEGVGDTPEDYYIAYFDQSTHQLKMAVYIVTYPALTGGKPIDELEEHAIVYEEWQRVNGLLVPHKTAFYGWADGKLSEKAMGTMTFTTVSFKKSQPPPDIFNKPEGATVDRSHLSNK